MEIAFSTTPGAYRTDMGYGYAGIQIIQSLKELGHSVPYGKKRSPVHIAFTQPPFFNFGRNQYRIGYTPWESTKLPRGWTKKFNECDEVWATSPQVAEWFTDNGVAKPIYVYQHGIDPVWKTRKRRAAKKLRFLHIGPPAERKGSQNTIDAFIDAFGKSREVELTIKGYKDSSIQSPQANVKVMANDLPIDDLVRLYHQHHVMVYPSYGEGFGFIPFQAIATGMPTIVNDWWCPYREYTFPISYKLIDSPWPKTHPGKVAEPDHDDLVMLMREIRDHYDEYSQQAVGFGQELHREYNWRDLTEQAFSHIVEKFA